ncbi:MAG: hypothetical protein GY756_19655 [bacterium]|nr:hypothetical protein [bacterium]
MWWGDNATKAVHYENDVFVATKTLIDISPNTQKVTFRFVEKPNETYKYIVTMSNRFGSTTSAEFSITVTQSN